MKLYLAHEEDMLPEYAENVCVMLLAGNLGICHSTQGNCPDVTPDLHDWLKTNCKDDVYVGHYEPVQLGSKEDPLFAPVDHFTVPFWFADADQAMVFKLTWAGQ